MNSDLKKSEYQNNLLNDYIKNHSEFIAKINDETVKLLEKQLYSTEEVSLFKKDMDNKLASEYQRKENEKNIG